MDRVPTEIKSSICADLSLCDLIALRRTARLWGAASGPATQLKRALRALDLVRLLPGLVCLWFRRVFGRRGPLLVRELTRNARPHVRGICLQAAGGPKHDARSIARGVTREAIDVLRRELSRVRALLALC
jgi:hypothetical protein